MRNGNNEYLYYLLKANKKYITTQENGTVFGAINKKQIEKLLLPFPTNNNQKKIVGILKALDDKIFLNNQVIDTLEEIGKTMFKRWFIDFEFPEEDGKPFKSSGGQFVEVESDIIPKNWYVTKLKDFVSFSQGVQVPIENQSEIKLPGFERFIRIVDYTKMGEEPPRYIEKKDKRYFCNKDDVTIVRYGNIGLVGRRLEGFIANNLFKIIPENKIGNNFLFYFLNLKSTQQAILGSASGSAMPAIKHSTIGNLKIILPNNNGLLDKFENLTRDFEKMILKNMEENINLIKFRDALLPKLISGEISIPEAEGEVEECLQKSN